MYAFTYACQAMHMYAFYACICTHVCKAICRRAYMLGQAILEYMCTCTCACVHKYAYEKVWVCMHVTRVPVRVRLFEYKHDSICKSACIYVFFI